MIITIDQTCDPSTLKQKALTAKTITFNGCPDYMGLAFNIRHELRDMVFPRAYAVKFNANCNKNFICYWCTPVIFPNARVYYVMAKPADYHMHRRFDPVRHTIYINPADRRFWEGVPVKYIQDDPANDPDHDLDNRLIHLWGQIVLWSLIIYCIYIGTIC